MKFDFLSVWPHFGHGAGPSVYILSMQDSQLEKDVRENGETKVPKEDGVKGLTVYGSIWTPGDVAWGSEIDLICTLDIYPLHSETHVMSKRSPVSNSSTRLGRT